MIATESLPAPPVGFAGLGMMGSPIAERLAAGGVPLVVYNRTREKSEAALAKGARWAFTPKDLGTAASGGIVFLLLSDVKAVRAVLFGRRGLVRGAGKGTLVVDLSTVAPSESRAVGSELARQGLPFVDAPLGGSVQAARDGRLIVFAGGADDDVARARPLLERFARRVEHLGAVGAGTSAKLVNNLLTLGTAALDAEALAFGESLGLDRKRLLELLLDGGGRSAIFEQKRGAFAERAYPAEFKLSLAAKDLKLIERTARETGAATRLAREARRLVDEGVRTGLADADYAAVFEAALARRARTAPAASDAPTTHEPTSTAPTPDDPAPPAPE